MLEARTLNQKQQFVWGNMSFDATGIGEATSGARLELSLALSDNERTRPLIDGRVKAQGIRLMPTAVHPSEMFWRQLRFGDFDVSEMSMSSLIIATAKGDPVGRATGVHDRASSSTPASWCASDAGIKPPADLKGKRVGVPEYQQTAAIWGRGVLQHEFGVHARDIEWFMERNAGQEPRRRNRLHGAARRAA